MNHLPRTALSCLRWLAAILLAAFLIPTQARAFSAIPLPDSVKPVDQAPAAGALDPHKPLITRNSLKPAETAAPLPFEVNLKMRNFADLQARIARGELIFPKEMAAKYEPLPADYDAVAKWISGQGLTITRRDSHHMALFARGTVSQVQQALRVNFARVTLEGKEYTSAISTPSVPAAISPLLVGINGLQPHLHAHKHLIRQQVHPDATGGGAAYFPAQIATAYNVSSLYATDIQGSGQAIAIVIDTFPDPSDLVTFWKDGGINQSLSNIAFIQAVSGTLPAPSGEETLDTEWSSSMAPDAQVRVYAATDLGNADLDAAYQQVYDDVTNSPALGIHQMSMSYGEGETYTTFSQVETDDQFFAELAAAGVTVFASSGDDGSTPGGGGTGDDSGPVQVETPASDPNVTGVGGTTLVLSASNTVTSETVWNNGNNGASGGGFSRYFKRPSWQNGTGVTTGTNREVPDVAASADPNYGAEIVQGGVLQPVGGTSWSSPTWAGICALINQARADTGQITVGLLGPHIYSLLVSPAYPTSYLGDFNDITSGNNATRFSGGDYSATPGFDLCTGLGTPRAQPLAGLLNGPSALVGVLAPAPVVQVAAGQHATFSVSASGPSPAYQWQRMAAGTSTWISLTNNATYGGVTGPILTVSNVTTGMSGNQFQCLVTLGSYTVTTTPPAVLVVDATLNVGSLAGRTGSTGRANAAGTGARFNYPSGVALDGFGNIYVADYGNNEIREVTSTGTVTTPYGNLSGNAGDSDGSGNGATFNAPNAVAIDASNDIFVADSGNNSIREITAGTVSTLPGNSVFNSPEGVAVDAFGNVYVADSGNNVVREISSGGAVSILAGRNGVAGFANGNATTQALFNDPISVAVDGMGDVFVADFGNNVVREISGGLVTTAAGQPAVSGYLDGLAANALFNAPVGLSIDAAGNLYIADSQVPSIGSTAAGNCVLRKLSPAGVVSTLAGQAGIAGSKNGVGAAANFYSIQGVTENSAGQFYMADTYNQTIRSGTASTPATTGTTIIISLSGNMAFGNIAVGQTGTSTLTIGNSGNTPLIVTGVSYPTGFSGDFTTGTIASGNFQDVSVTFTPTSEIAYSGSIAVTSNATAGSGSIAASGSGVINTILPAVSTSPATDVGESTATLNGSVNPEGSLTNFYFQYGPTQSYGSVTGTVNAGSATASSSFAAPVTGLQAATPYHYQAVATSGTNTVFGNDETFTTLAFTTTAVAATGGLAADITGAGYSAFGSPAMNDLDDIAFYANLLSGDGGVTSANNAGIWAQDDTGTRHLVARVGEVAPGTGIPFTGMTNPVYNNNEAVAFLGALRTGPGLSTPFDSIGIWSTSGGSLALLARRGTQAPGYPIGIAFTTFLGIALPDQGGVILFAAVDSHTDNIGIWEGDSASNLTLVFKLGQTFNGLPITGVSFLPELGYVGAQSRSFAQSTGQIAFEATFGRSGSGILKLTGTTLSSIVMTQAAAPGVTGGLFRAFSTPAINGTGNIAFLAALDVGPGGVSAAESLGIWADDITGTLQLVAQTLGLAPGADGLFQSLSDPAYNDNNAVAFHGTMRIGIAGITSANANGVWSNSSGSLALVAQQGAQAPGCPAGATFESFLSIALPNQGGTVFLATLKINSAIGVNASNDVGIWAVDTNGNLQLIARTGQTINGKTITSLSFIPILPLIGGQTRNFNQSTGDLVYQATYSDKTTGISVVTFP